MLLDLRVPIVPSETYELGYVGTLFSNLPAPPDLGAVIPAFLPAFLTGEFSIGLPERVVLATGKFSAYNTTGSTLLFPILSLSGEKELYFIPT